MTYKDYLIEKLLSGVETWNQWRAEHPIQDEERLDLTGVNLCGANLCGADLSEVDLSDSCLSGADLSQAKLYAACLTGANLSHANLSCAVLNGALFTLADLSGASLSGADLRSTRFLLSDCLYQLHRADFDAIILAMRRHHALQTYLLKANLHACDLRSAHLQGAMFHQANLSQANLRKAEICKTDFQYADLNVVDLSGAQMPYANLRGTHLRYANLVGTNLDKARTEGTDFEGATYSSDTILPALSRLQRQSLVWVESPPQPVNKEVIVDLESLLDERQRTNVARVRRKDQQKFREALKEAFSGKCAITFCDVEGALDAAHIFPYRGPQTDCVWNGILLRLDLHRLFDAYLLTVDPVEGQVYLEESLMNSYGQYANTRICFPEQPVSENRKQALRWHNAQCSWFKGD